MKKIFTYLLVLATVTTVVSCDDKNDPVPGPTIAWASNPDFKKMDITEEMDVKIQVDAPAGIKTFKVAVKSEVLNDMGITELDLIEPGENVKQYMDMILGGAGSPMDKTSYLLDLSQLVPMLNTLTNAESDHTFTLTVGDKQNLTATRTAVFHRVQEIPKMELGENAALKVNMFTEFNVKSIDDKTVTFYDKLENIVPDDPETAYFTYTELQEKGLTKSDGSEILMDAEGKKYRLPTSGELNLLVPMWKYEEDKGVLCPQFPDYIPDSGYHIAEKATTEGWVETIYLKNGLKDYPDYPDNETNSNEIDGDYRISGKSWLKRGATAELFYRNNIDLAPVYGLRFQGTSQYAAYRWEYCRIDNVEMDRYLSIKIKALRKDDVTTTIGDVAKESFWTDGYIEFKFPASGYYQPGETTLRNIQDFGFGGYCWSSSRVLGNSNISYFAFIPYRVAVGPGTPLYRYSLRLVRVEE